MRTITRKLMTRQVETRRTTKLRSRPSRRSAVVRLERPQTPPSVSIPRRRTACPTPAEGPRQRPRYRHHPLPVGRQTVPLTQHTPSDRRRPDRLYRPNQRYVLSRRAVDDHHGNRDHPAKKHRQPQHWTTTPRCSLEFMNWKRFIVLYLFFFIETCKL